MAVKGNFKPFVGRFFELKNFTDLKKYPQIVLVLDEKKNQVMFLDNEGNATWTSKFYLRDNPIESRVFANPDTIAGVTNLIEKMRSSLVEFLASDKKTINTINKSCSTAVAELRDLGTRMQGVQFAPPRVLEEESEDVQ